MGLSTEERNLVMFPASKNYPIGDILNNDLIEEIVNEFSHLGEDELDNYLHRPMAKNDYHFYVREDSDRSTKFRIKLKKIKDKIEDLEESTKKLRYLLKEIEQYCPNRNL